MAARGRQPAPQWLRGGICDQYTYGKAAHGQWQLSNLPEFSKPSALHWTEAFCAAQINLAPDIPRGIEEIVTAGSANGLPPDTTYSN